jgi:hypothetical protein
MMPGAFWMRVWGDATMNPAAAITIHPPNFLRLIRRGGLGIIGERENI